MKNNTEPSKQALYTALRSLPQDDVMSEARYHIRAAINKIEHVEKKRTRRETTQTAHDKWQESLAQGRKRLAEGVNAPVDPMQQIRLIDKMISEERRKLAELEQNRQKKTLPAQQDVESDDDDDFSTILG